jgi:AAA family ATP:ADP antiporter
MLGAFADVRPEERRGVLAAFLSLFGIISAHTTLETARDALFLSRLPSSQLPWVYLAMAVVAVVVSQGPFRPPRSLSSAQALAVLLAACSLGTLGFWLLGVWSSPWALRALYVWVGLVGTLTGLQFWLALGEAYTIAQAKRLYKLIALGSLLGAVFGSGVARALSVQLAAQHLVLAAALLMAVSVLPVLFLRRPEGGFTHAEMERTSVHDAVAMLGRHPYLVRLAGLVLLSTVAVTLADYLFKSNVARVVEKSELGAFFATYYMVLNALALVVQVGALGWLLRTLGLHRSLFVLPAALFVGASAIAFGGGFVAAVLLKAADGTLRPSIQRTGTEMLFLPLSDSLRARAKPLIDVVGQRGGQALASIFILGEVSLGRGDFVLASATAVLCIVWVAWSFELQPLYVELFRSAVREGSLQERVDLPELDLGSLETLIGALNSDDDYEVLGAIDLLAAEKRAHLVPALVLYHPSTKVVLRALSVFERSGRTDFLPVADRILQHADPEVRAAALRARTSVRPDEKLLRRGGEDADPLVRATALAGLVSSGWVSDELQVTLDELLQSGSPEACSALARAVARQPSPAFEDVLLQLSRMPSPEVQVETAHAMGAVRSERFLPALLDMLALRHVRPAARDAFLAHREPALAYLEHALADTMLPHEIRRHLPRTISVFAPADAVRVLQARFLPETDGMVRFKILRGLGRLVTDHPEVRVDPAVTVPAAERTLEAGFRLLHWRLVLEGGVREDRRRETPGHSLLVTLLRDKEVHALERLFRLLGLLHLHEDWKGIYRGVRSTQAKRRAGSREIVEYALRPPMREAVLALVDDGEPRDRLARAAPYYTAGPLAYEDLLRALLADGSETVRSIAAYHVGEIGLQALRPQLEAMDPGRIGFFNARVVERALVLLAGPRPDPLGAA